MMKSQRALTPQPLPPFATRVIAWQKKHGRHDLPWQNTRDPYRIWLSEIMLQQTQVDTVMDYYARFLTAFPDVETLARAPIDQVLALWSGLGYYRRAHHLHAAAKAIALAGAFPDQVDTLKALPGVGRSTAGAIAVFAFERRAAIMDGNARRVLTRHHGIFDEKKNTDPELWALAETLLPKKDLIAYTQGMMDLGATLCARAKPACEKCPVSGDCEALRLDRAPMLPPSRAVKNIEERAFWLLIVKRGKKIFLEPRDHSTIWAGLYSFPECAPYEAARENTVKTPEDYAREEVKRRLGWIVTDVRFEAVITHRLTHRKLVMTPVTLTAREGKSAGAKNGVMAARNGVMATRDEALALALPTPIRKWIAAFM